MRIGSRIVACFCLTSSMLTAVRLAGAAGEPQDLGVVPTPQKVEWAPGSFPVDETTTILLSPETTPAERFAAKDLQESLRRQLNLTLTIATRREGERPPRGILLGSPRRDRQIRDRLDRLDLRLDQRMAAEGYVLGVDGEGIVIASESPAGILYGTTTLRQMLLARDPDRRLPAVRIEDWPAMRYRGVHDEISYGQVSTMDNFKDLIRFCALFKMNTFMVYMEDMYRFRSYPTIGVGRGALTREQIDELEAFAKPYNVEIIPIFETLGNQGALLMLDEVRPYAEYPGAHSFAVGEETDRFLSKTLGELFEAFDSKNFHVGLDESWDLGFGKTRPRVEKEGRGAVHADHYRRVHRLLKDRGKTMMMYADIILNRPEILNLIPKDIVLMDWHYEPDQNFPSVAKLRKAGFPLIVLPGLNNWDRIFPMQSAALINIRNFTLEGYKQGALGSITSTWGDNGSKNLRELNYYGYAYGAQVSWKPEETDVLEFGDRFFALWNGPGTATDMEAIYALLEKWPWWYSLLDYFRDPFLPRKDDRTPTEQDLFRVREDARVAIRLAKQAAAKATRRKGDLDYLIYCARMHRNYVDGQLLVRELTQFEATDKSTSEVAKAKEKFLADLEDQRRDVVRLRDQFRDLWLRTNLPANLHYALEEYDRQIKAWEDAAKRIAEGKFAYDPRPPAQWIYHPTGFTPQTPVPHAFFRKTFDADPDSLQRAHIQLYGDTHLVVYVNGKRVGEQFARRNLSAPVNPQLVKIYDLMPLLEKGKNVIAVEARNYGTENKQLDPGGPDQCGGFILYGELQPKRGRAQTLTSDETWRVSERSVDGWTKPGFRDVDWPRAKRDPHPTIWVTYPDFVRNLPGDSAAR